MTPLQDHDSYRQGYDEGFNQCQQSPEFVRLEARVGKNSDNISNVTEGLDRVQQTMESVRRWIIITLCTSIVGVGGAALSIGRWQGVIETRIDALQMAFEHHVNQASEK